MENSSFGRLVGVLFSPGKTFASIAERPTWAVALLVLLASSAIVGFVSGSRTDYRDVLIESARDKGREVNEAQMEPAIQMMEKGGPAIAAVSTPVFVALVVLIAALLYWLGFKLIGSDFSYKSSLSVALHGSMPVVVSLLLSIPVILSRSTITYADMKKSGGSFLQSNLSFLAPEDAAPWMRALFASVDFFSLWGLVLTILGFTALTRKPAGSVAGPVIVIWLLFVAIRVVMAAFSG